MLATLERLRLLRGSAEVSAGAPHLPRLCAEGALEGGLSVALDVRPDEAFGALAASAGGPARRLKVLDVRDRPEPRMVVSLGTDPQAQLETWDVPDVRALVERLNALAAEEPRANVIAVLGEWDDALQLWALPRSALRALLKERDFRPENLAELRALATS